MWSNGLCCNVIDQFIMNCMRDLQPVPTLYIQDLKSFTISVQSDVQESFMLVIPKSVWDIRYIIVGLGIYDFKLW